MLLTGEGWEESEAICFYLCAKNLYQMIITLKQLTPLIAL